MSSPDAKRQFYARPEIASVYDELRFGGASGAWVDAREIDIVTRLLPPFRRALDLGCGTGRLTRALAPRGETIGLDSSAAMLAQARHKVQAAFAQGDAFHLPFVDASFDTITALRVAFHVADLETLLKEIARVLTPRGVFIFDTYTWSPRAWRPLDPARWGGSVHIHSPRGMEHLARALELEIVGREYCFLFSPYVYRRLPFALVRACERIELLVPARWRARVFWKMIRS